MTLDYSSAECQNAMEPKKVLWANAAYITNISTSLHCTHLYQSRITKYTGCNKQLFLTDFIVD